MNKCRTFKLMKTGAAYHNYICIQNCHIKFISKDEKYKTFPFKQSNKMKQIWMNYYWIMSFCQQHNNCSQILNHQLHNFLLFRQIFKIVSFLTSRKVSIVERLGILLYYMHHMQLRYWAVILFVLLSAWFWYC